MGNRDVEDEIAVAVAGLDIELDGICSAVEAFAMELGPPVGPLSKPAAAAFLGIPRRTLRSLIERGHIVPADDGRLYAKSLREQYEAHRARVAARKARRP